MPSRKKIRIAFNASMLDDRPTGTGVFTINLINQFTAQETAVNWERITVFTPTEKQLNNTLNIAKISSYSQASRYGKLAAVYRFLWNTLVYPISARSFDILINPTTHGNFFLNNQILTIHDLISLRNAEISRHQHLYFRYLLPYLIKKSQKIIAVSESTKIDIIELLNCPPEKIAVIYNGYDRNLYFPLKSFTRKILTEYGYENYLLAVGPTYKHKNFINLLEAYKTLDERLKIKHPLLIAGGKNPYLDTIKTFIKENGLTNHVHFLGYVPLKMMPSLYREAQMLVFPSLYEGFGLPLLEAMACGCPVITSNTSSMPEVCADAALYFNPYNKEDLAEKINQLLHNDQLKANLIEKGLQQCKVFSWEKTANHYKKEINHIIQTKK